jgi:hypothetical protein
MASHLVHASGPPGNFYGYYFSRTGVLEKIEPIQRFYRLNSAFGSWTDLKHVFIF